MIRNFKSDKAIIYPYGSWGHTIFGNYFQSSTTNGIMELTQLNDMTYVNATEVFNPDGFNKDGFNTDSTGKGDFVP